MTQSTLQKQTCKDLAGMARKQGVTGWHSMRKEQLIRALLGAAKAKSNRNVARAASLRVAGPQRGKTELSPAEQSLRLKSQQRMSQVRSKLDAVKNLSMSSVVGDDTTAGVVRDRLVVMVRDPYWLHAYWELSLQSIQRAQAALRQHWHAARPVLRLFQVSDDDAARLVRTLDIHGGVSNWYIDVQDPPEQFQLDIGYLTANDHFHRLARSNTVSTPQPGITDALDENWVDVAQNADRIFAMSGGYSPQGTSRELQELLEERLRRPMGSPMRTRFGNGASDPRDRDDELLLAVDAELVVCGATQKGTHVTLNGEPVQLRPDGTFAVRLNMPDRRQVIPIVASTSDGVEQRTIILAVDRNTKALERVARS